MASVLLVALSAAAGCSSGDASGENDNTGGAVGTGATGSGATTGSGGETGTGAAAATGGDGSGGGSTTTSVCTATNTAPAEAGSIAPAEDLVAEAWDAYQSTPDVDGAAGATITTDAEGELDPDGHTSTAFHYAGTGWATYGAGFNVNLLGCKDLSGLTGVKFWAKGTTAASTDQTKPPSITENNLNFRVITPGAHGVIMDGGKNVGGDCVVDDGGCFQPPQKNIALTGEWQLFEVPFADLETPAAAAPGSSLEESGNVAMLIGWHSEGGDFDVYVDDVEFY